MGFTAINSSSPPRPREMKQALGATRPVEASSSDPHTTVASAYLGRGKHDESAPTGKPTPKKASGKGKKRATTAPAPQNAKKRKTSTVPDAVPATKMRDISKKQETARACAGDPTGGAALQHELAPAPKKNSKNRNLGGAHLTSALTPVSVIAPSTSMGSLSNVSKQTSCDAVKSSSGHGALLYNSFSSPTKPCGGVEFSQPLLDQARKAPQSSMQVGQPANEADDSAFDDDDNDFGALFDELAERIGSKTTPNPPIDNPGRFEAARIKTRKQTKHSPARATPPRDQDDVFMVDDDDDFTEAMIAAGELRETPTSTRGLRPATKQQHPLTPPASDTNGVIIARKSRQSADGVHGDRGDITMIDSDEDEDMIELDKVMKAAEKANLQPRPRKQNMRSISQHEDYGGALLNEAEKKSLSEFVAISRSRVKDADRLAEELRSAALNADTKPVIRSAFPDPVLDRSPILGATNSTVLRTCFRLGEALNVGSHAVRNNKNVFLEVYARVSSSAREGRKQRFMFKDLYHDKPPHLAGDFELWSQSRLWDLDGRGFLNADGMGVMCRAIARMKRDGAKWRLEVLSIWQAGWDDVEAVAGIFSKDGADGSNDED